MKEESNYGKRLMAILLAVVLNVKTVSTSCVSLRYEDISILLRIYSIVLVFVFVLTGWSLLPNALRPF